MNRSSSDVSCSALRARLAHACAALTVELHAYCVLPRHYHVLMRAERPRLAAVLAHLDATPGFALSRPPHVVPVALGRHLLSVSRYIHLNPVDAGLAWRPEEWAFTSFRAYLGDPEAPPWILTEAVLGGFGAIGARHRHRAYVYAGMDPDTRDALGRPRWPALFGAGTLQEDLAWRLEPVLAVRAPKGVPDGGDAGALPGLARAVAAAHGIPPQVLRTSRAGGSVAREARGALVHAARALGGIRLRDVALFMGYARAASAAAAAERYALGRPDQGEVKRPASSRIM